VWVCGFFFLMLPPQWCRKVIFLDFLHGNSEENILPDFVKKFHLFYALPQRCSPRIKTYVPILNKEHLTCDRPCTKQEQLLLLSLQTGNLIILFGKEKNLFHFPSPHLESRCTYGLGFCAGILSSET
jgi:hypothetical protein